MKVYSSGAGAGTPASRISTAGVPQEGQRSLNEGFTVTVKTEHGENIALKCENSTKVVQLLTNLSVHTSVSMDKLALVFRGRLLPSSALLADYGVRAGASLHLAMNYAPTWVVVVRTPAGDLVSYDATDSQTVNEFRSLLENKLRIEKQRLHFFIDGKRLIQGNERLREKVEGRTISLGVFEDLPRVFVYYGTRIFTLDLQPSAAEQQLKQFLSSRVQQPFQLYFQRKALTPQAALAHQSQVYAVAVQPGTSLVIAAVDHRDYYVLLARTAVCSGLKSELAALTGVPPQRQRLKHGDRDLSDTDAVGSLAPAVVTFTSLIAVYVRDLAGRVLKVATTRSGTGNNLREGLMAAAKVTNVKDKLRFREVAIRSETRLIDVGLGREGTERDSLVDYDDFLK